MKHTAETLSEIHKRIGTITDLSKLCEIQADAIKYGPEITDKDLKSIQKATTKRLWCENEVFKIDFHKDGKKILSFAQAYNDRRNDLWNDFFEHDKTESDWNLAKMILRWFVECSEQEVKQKCVDFLNAELRPEDWQYITDHGCGFLKKSPNMYETTDKEKRDMARVFSGVRDDMTGYLTRFWLELFSRHGVQGAKDWIRDNWNPLNDETREKINAAYVAAKQEFKNEAA